MEDGGEGAARAGPGVACSPLSTSRQRGAAEGRSGAPVPEGGTAGARPGEERAARPERSALLSVPPRPHSLRPVTPWRSLAVLGGEVF